MRCLSCDRKLNDYERTRKYASSGTFVDLCNRCFAEIADDVPDLDGDGVEYFQDEDEVTDHGEGLEGFNGFTSEDEDGE
jgi:hypothetical protein